MLYGEVDVEALTAPCDLDAISERADRSVRPATSAVLGNVLVTIHRAVVDSVLVAPGKCFRKIRGLDVFEVRFVRSLNIDGIKREKDTRQLT